jgi:hypothetical protein
LQQQPIYWATPHNLSVLNPYASPLMYNPYQQPGVFAPFMGNLGQNAAGAGNNLGNFIQWGIGGMGDGFGAWAAPASISPRFRRGF